MAVGFDFRTADAAPRDRLASAWRDIAVDAGGAPQRRPLDRVLRDTDTLAFIVVRDDTVLYEGYFNGCARDKPVTSFSIAKSFTSALVGCAIADGRIGSVEDPVTRYVPELRARDTRYERITLRHLLTMASGIRYVERSLPSHTKGRSQASAGLRRPLNSPSPIKPASMSSHA